MRRRKLGRPRVTRALKRVDLRTTVDSMTLRWLRAQRGPVGRVVDRLVAAEMQREEEA